MNNEVAPWWARSTGESKTDEKMEPCMWCGSKNVILQHKGACFYGQCKTCHADGRKIKRVQAGHFEEAMREAIDTWNALSKLVHEKKCDTSEKSC